jgi:hypothetical protein
MLVHHQMSLWPELERSIPDVWVPAKLRAVFASECRVWCTRETTKEPPPPSCMRSSRRASRWAWGQVLLADLDHLLMCDAVASPLSPLRPPTPPPSVGYGVLQKLRRSRTHAHSRGATWTRGARELTTCASRAGRLIRSHATRHASGKGAHRGCNGPRVHTIFFPCAWMRIVNQTNGTPNQPETIRSERPERRRTPNGARERPRAGTEATRGYAVREAVGYRYVFFFLFYFFFSFLSFFFCFLFIVLFSFLLFIILLFYFHSYFIFSFFPIFLFLFPFYVCVLYMWCSIFYLILSFFFLINFYLFHLFLF